MIWRMTKILANEQPIFLANDQFFGPNEQPKFWRMNNFLANDQFFGE